MEAVPQGTAQEAAGRALEGVEGPNEASGQDRVHTEGAQRYRPRLHVTRYVGDAKNKNEERKQEELLAKIIARPDHYWRCFEACSRVFISGFVLYDVAQLELQGEKDEAKALSDCLERDGWTPEGVEEGVRQMCAITRNLAAIQQ